jgi:hypothetical protein
MSEFADYVHDKTDTRGFDLAPIQWAGGNGTCGYIIEVYLQAILPPEGRKETRQLTSVHSHYISQPVRLPWETESIQVYYTVEQR